MPQCDFKKRPTLVQVDSELQILTFRSAKRTGFLKRSKSDGKRSDMGIRWPKSSEFGPKSDDWAHRILRSKNSIGLHGKNVTEQNSVRQQHSPRYTQAYE